MRYSIKLSRAASRALSELLPEGVAAAVWEFMTGPLTTNPQRVGKPLRYELEGLYAARRGEYRVVYQIREDQILIEIIDIEHRRDVYRR